MVLFFYSAIQAQIEESSIYYSGRPGFFNGAGLVPKGVVQNQLGINYGDSTGSLIVINRFTPIKKLEVGLTTGYRKGLFNGFRFRYNVIKKGVSLSLQPELVTNYKLINLFTRVLFQHHLNSKITYGGNIRIHQSGELNYLAFTQLRTTKAVFLIEGGRWLFNNDTNWYAGLGGNILLSHSVLLDAFVAIPTKPNMIFASLGFTIRTKYKNK